MRYSKLSGAFEYAAKRVLADKNNTLLLRQGMPAAYNQLENGGYKAIETIYKDNPGESDAESIYEIARIDIAYMRIIFQNI